MLNNIIKKVTAYWHGYPDETEFDQIELSVDKDGDVLMVDAEGTMMIHITDLAEATRELLIAHNNHMKEQLND